VGIQRVSQERAKKRNHCFKGKGVMKRRPWVLAALFIIPVGHAREG